MDDRDPTPPALPAWCFTRAFGRTAAQRFEVPQHYLLYAASGALRLEAAGRTWSLPPARAALIAAGNPILVTIPQRVETASVLFEPGFVEPPSEPLAVFEMTPLARELVLELRDCGPEKPHLDVHTEMLFRTLASVTWRLARTPSPATMPSGSSDILRRALSLTEKRMDDSPRFDEIAADLATTPRSLARRFAEETGMTWRECLRRMRMIRAIEALADTDVAVTEVAFRVGYSSLSAFNAAFLAFTGSTPTGYRASFGPKRKGPGASSAPGPEF